MEYELILVSDVHCAQTRQVAGEFLRDEDHYLERGLNLGPANSRNLGLTQARGQYVLFFDDDDELPPVDYDKFLSEAFKSPRQVTFGDIVIVREDREKGLLTGEPPSRIDVSGCNIDQIYVKNFIPLPAAVFPRWVAQRCLFDPYMESLEDWDFMLQALSKTDFSPVNLLTAIVYKDFVNMGNRRGSSVEAMGVKAILEYLYVYRRWPAPSAEIYKQREILLTHFGLKQVAEIY